MSTDSVQLWLKSEPFTIGALPIPPHSRLTASNIRKIVPYAKTKGSSGYPNLSYSMWKHIACNKLQIPEGLTSAYFITFDMLNCNSKLLQERDLKLSSSAYTQSLETVLQSQSVPALSFVLYLLVQHYHKISLRESLVSGSDEWPSKKRFSDQEMRNTKGLYENSHMTFFVSHLKEILEILSEPAMDETEDEDASTVSDARGLTIGLEAAYALDFLIAGSLDDCKTILPFHEIATMPAFQQKTFYSEVLNPFNPDGTFRSLQAWIHSHLTTNPFGLVACSSNGKKVEWPLLDEYGEPIERSIRGKITTNTYMTSKDDAKGNRVVVLSMVSRETLGRCTGNLDGCTIRVHKCHYSYIYLLSPLRSVIIDGCVNSTIVVGAAELSVDLINCESTTVIAACRRFTALGCKSCTVHLLTPNRPILFNGNSGLVFAPHNTFYGKLEDHMTRVGLLRSPNAWNLPLYVGNETNDESVMWEIIQPENFYTFSIPFDIKGSTKSMPGHLPAEYEKALDTRLQRIKSWQKLTHKTKITPDQKEAFQQLVEKRFQEWLISSGLKREIDSLASCSTAKF